jgi:hypothetical protein
MATRRRTNMDRIDAITLILATNTYYTQPDWMRDVLVLELGYATCFELYHRDDVMFGGWF